MSFLEWFSGDPVLAAFYIIAVPSTVILVLQTVFLLFGLGGDHDADLGADNGIEGVFGHDSPDITDGHDASDSSGLRLFTVRGIVAFFAVGSWSGIAALSLGASKIVASAAALLMGIAALVFVAAFLKLALKLQANGNLCLSNSVGKTGEVYLTVPAGGKGRGKVNVIIQERLTELEAITNGDQPLTFGQRIRVVAMADENTAIVEADK